jgi:hypothetical protein
MGINGDLPYALSDRMKCSYEEAAAHLRFILDHADDANFAIKFAQAYEAKNVSAAMSFYWDVIQFLKDTQT